MTVREWHRRAMALVDHGMRVKQTGNHVEAKRIFRRAYSCARHALALFLRAGIAEPEPTRTVLARSAARTATRAGLTREAERMHALADTTTSEAKP